MTHLYRMHDTESTGMILCTPDEAKHYNPLGWGIFQSVNEFENGSRRLEHLVNINAWAVDIDTGDKKEMMERIMSPHSLVPSVVNETARGYHVYWNAMDATVNTWNEIVLNRLVPFYGADPKARDICRVLRAPGYNHMKNPCQPFPIKTVWTWDVSYTENQMKRFYVDYSDNKESNFIPDNKREIESNDFWDRIFSMNCIDALSRLSGSHYVNREVYDFKKNTNGNYNIFVNGNKTSCFIDKNYKIGSLDGGGPSVYQWLLWFGHEKRKVAEILSKVFPELKSDK